jgi:hypothetical protein
MPTIPMHLDLGFALLIIGVLFLLAFSPWFRRFALVCVALMVVAAGVGYMATIDWGHDEQTMRRKCDAGAETPSPGLDSSCDEWFAKKYEQDMREACTKPHAPGLPPDREVFPNRPFRNETCEQWLPKHLLPKHGGAAVLHGPDVDLRRRPASIAAPRAFCTEDHDPVTLGENVIDLNPERAVRQCHEVLEKSQHFGVSVVVS